MISREQAVLNFLEEIAPLNMHGILLSLKGETIAEGYWAPFRADLPHRLYSVSKSLVSLAIGILVREKKIELDTPVIQYFPEYISKDTSPLLMELTIRNMLRMATCYDRAQYAPLEDADWTKPFFQGTPTHVSGTVFSYDTSSSQVLASLIEKIAGCDVFTFLNLRLFHPLRMDGEKRWLKDPSGNIQGGTGLVMTLRDFSKVANFLLSDGIGIVDESYLREATSWQIATGERSGREERYGYGYQFWMMRSGFSMYCMAGQMAMCLPDSGIVLCTTADLLLDAEGVQPLYDAFFRHLSQIDQLPHSADDAVKLRDQLSALTVKPVTGNHCHDAIAVSLVNHTLPFHQIRISETEVTLSGDSEIIRFPLVPGKWTESRIFNIPCLCSGAWNDDQYHLHIELTGDWCNAMDIYAVCTEKRATVRLVSATWEITPGWNGQDWGYLQPDPYSDTNHE